MLALDLATYWVLWTLSNNALKHMVTFKYVSSSTEVSRPIHAFKSKHVLKFFAGLGPERNTVYSKHWKIMSQAPPPPNHQIGWHTMKLKKTKPYKTNKIWLLFMCLLVSECEILAQLKPMAKFSLTSTGPDFHPKSLGCIHMTFSGFSTQPWGLGTYLKKKCGDSHVITCLQQLSFKINTQFHETLDKRVRAGNSCSAPNLAGMSL